MSTVLRAQGLTKRFGGFVAVDDVNLSIREGSIHALIGPNGAGKTTCFNLLTKFLQPTTGQILFRDRDITRLEPAEVARLGIIRSFQISAVFGSLTAGENLLMALQRPTALPNCFWRSSSVLLSLEDRAREVARTVNLHGYFDRPAGELSYGRKRALEIATTIALEPQVMLLDEPMAGMGLEDVAVVADVIREAARDKTVVMVEHNLKVVKDLCERVTVLQRGQVLVEGGYDEISENAQVRSAYMGSEQ
ncbi:ABC transporter ATP-binding protein [Ramlibacter henchirensis]|uniref:ABC transporter ATP-binding protein n=1 Tax=Ramlibacter henchirensis TaxID=204072 RepID=A0A4Z0BUF8_9BURK|nr:ABC transporter ATP-binding protein [Ramlibacter henchirensis]TFZ02933.1 ABC transporter ATP-binding protein [Ramlibacter henchirensis]